MNPIYKFELTAGDTTQRAFPIYKDDLAIDFEKESGQEFFRRKLSGELTFESDDYTFIFQQAFDTQFVLEIFISTNAGQSWSSYWKGTFWKTDCSFDDDAETVVVKPSVFDQYSDIMAGLDREYNLIELAPNMAEIKADKRPMVQVYVPGQTVIGCFLSGMWWEQECDAESDESKLIEVGDGKLNFALNKTVVMADVSGTMTPELPDMLIGTIIGAKFNGLSGGTYEWNNGDYLLRYYFYGGGGGAVQRWQIERTSDSTVLWQFEWTGGTMPQTTLPMTVVLSPMNGATGNVTLYIHETSVYSRYICDTDAINTQPTFEIGSDDIVPNNRNYRRVIAYYFPDTIYFSTQLTTTPTQWGLYQPGQYYVQFLSPIFGINETFPVARSAWGRVSIWFASPIFGELYEEPARQPFTIKNAYPLWSVLQVLLNKVAPDVTFRANYNSSQFLYPYDTNPISGLDFRLYIIPKSNIVNAGYDEPAQTAPITLRNVFEMLRDCFRCYWFIDDSGLLHIEHISWFMKGGTYSGSPYVGIDLTGQTVPRNGKAWAFARNQYKFDKPEMASRYQFGWMDEVTKLFVGYPIDIVSRYVDPEKIEQVNVSRFTSDIDYVLLNPGDVSKDGFVLLAAVYNPGQEIEQYDPTTFTKRSRWINTTTGLWGSSTTNKHILIPVVAGQRIKVTPHNERIAQLAWLTDNSASVSGGTPSYVPGTTIMVQDAGTTEYYTVPNGALYMYVYLGTGDDYPYTPAYIGLVGEPGYFLPYVNVIDNYSDHYLQNAYVAFCLLQQYYDYDMPAKNYEINGTPHIAAGVKKLKKQTISFPLLTDPDLFELIKTNLGDGVIEKLSLNLSSRNVNATLKYDTE